jgi:hypothetical protein
MVFEAGPGGVAQTKKLSERSHGHARLGSVLVVDHAGTLGVCGKDKRQRAFRVDTGVVSDPDAADRDAVHPLLTAHFAVFRRAQTERDLEDQIDFVPPILERYGLVPSQARLVPMSSGKRVWVTPGMRGAALSEESVAARGRGSWFGSAESVASRGLWGLSEDLEGRRSLCGLVADGNPVVGLDLRDGGRLTVPVVEGVVIATEIERINAIEFLDAAGDAQRQLC